MIIERSNERVSPILIQPRHDLDELKTQTQQILEREKGIRNDQTKQIAQMATQEVYKQMEKAFKNTEYNVRLRVDELGGSEQFEITMKKDGKVLASLPPDSAIQMAEQAKRKTVGILFDLAV